MLLFFPLSICLSKHAFFLWVCGYPLGLLIIVIIIIIIIYALTARVFGAPQMISQPVSSIFLCFPLPSGTNSRPVHSLVLSCNLFFCLPCLLLPFTVPCKMVLARPDKREALPYYCSLRLFTMVRRSSCGLIACWNRSLKLFVLFVFF